jgi:predicted acylesterase/phospholipase RssA
VAFAAGIRSGHEKEMAAKLVNAWIEGGGWGNSLSFSPWNWLRGRGLSDRGGLLKMLNDLVKPCKSSEKREVELRIIVAPLNGVQGAIGSTPATTYEKFFHFSGKDFDTAEGLARIFEATTAACAFPGLFAPVELDGLGPCVDGGAVNNAPIKYALDEGDIDQVIMPIPFPALMPAGGSRHGLGLLNHLIEILINERLYRDLKDAQVINEKVAALDKLVSNGELSLAQVKAVKKVLGNRLVQVVEIRPDQSTSKNAFSGFFSKKDRVCLVDEGRKAALKSLSQLKPTSESIAHP